MSSISKELANQVFNNTLLCRKIINYLSDFMIDYLDFTICNDDGIKLVGYEYDYDKYDEYEKYSYDCHINIHPDSPTLRILNKLYDNILVSKLELCRPESYKKILTLDLIYCKRRLDLLVDIFRVCKKYDISILHKLDYKTYLTNRFDVSSKRFGKCMISALVCLSSFPRNHIFAKCFENLINSCYPCGDLGRYYLSEQCSMPVSIYISKVVTNFSRMLSCGMPGFRSLTAYGLEFIELDDTKDPAKFDYICKMLGYSRSGMYDYETWYIESPYNRKETNFHNVFTEIKNLLESYIYIIHKCRKDNTGGRPDSIRMFLASKYDNICNTLDIPESDRIDTTHLYH